MVASHETGPANSPERHLDTKELAEIAAERNKDVEKNLEVAKTKETSKSERVESARHEVEQHLKAHEGNKAEQEQPQAQERKHVDPNTSFKHVMKTVQSQMSGPSRTFSKVIHNPLVEKTSETVGSTVARPNAILAGAVFAFIFTLATYLIGRWFAYPLSGFETIGAFILGWVIGIIYDFLKVMVTGKKA